MRMLGFCLFDFSDPSGAILFDSYELKKEMKADFKEDYNMSAAFTAGTQLAEDFVANPLGLITELDLMFRWT